MKKPNKILWILLIILIGWQIVSWLVHVNRMYRLQELKTKVEILNTYSEYEFRDIQIQKE